jgi:hypothetical protein
MSNALLTLSILLLVCVLAHQHRARLQSARNRLREWLREPKQPAPPVWACDVCGAAYLRSAEDVRAQHAAWGCRRCDGCVRDGRWPGAEVVQLRRASK